ncbi:hypothetical protein HG530_008426 [Fusarium avenaceum]|nr:hypothetical protein HG530_008426 [Fusarium avenaceum]
MENDEDWNNWFKNVGMCYFAIHGVLTCFKDHPKLYESRPGLVLILARRRGEPRLEPVKNMEADDWVRGIRKVSGDAAHSAAALRETGGQRNLRNLPFSRQMFKKVATEFYIHDSIIRKVSRADVSEFSAMKLEMGKQNGQSSLAHGMHSCMSESALVNTDTVYNIRTSNAWDKDLAASVTYFPHCGLTYAIMFGCTLIVAELERKRHLPIVEDTIDQVEKQILELNEDPELLEGVPEKEKANRNKAKRSTWLDINDDTEALNKKDESFSEYDLDIESINEWAPDIDPLEDSAEQRDKEQAIGTELQPYSPKSHKDLMRSSFYMRHTGAKIQGRLQEIMKDYNEKIRECSSGIEGMVMATQWAQGETNVEIALATSQDSRHMRSIALVTMVFLPGTFFASVFSMGFFDFKGSSGSVIVSRLFWLYVVLAVGFTALTHRD